MSAGDRYVKLVEWSDEDACFIGSCPELSYGGCHGDDAKAVFAELCEVVEQAIELYRREGRSLPQPMSGREFVNAMQGIA
jgi:predicted RNase H-like HicB family nuclease